MATTPTSEINETSLDFTPKHNFENDIMGLGTSPTNE